MTRLCAWMFGWAAPLLGLLVAIEPVPACAPAYGLGQQVAIASESAIIVWDEPTQTQHFIRRATFQTGVADFGFLVPTPTKPELAEASDQAFTTLEKRTEPRIVKVKAPEARGGLFTKSVTFAGAALPSGDVNVLESKRVAGYDAVVLEAKDPQALTDWLNKHGYVSRAALTAWLEPYVKNGWIITAFKIARQDQQSPGIATAAVRMSFKSARPFYPYSEPTDQRDSAAPDTHPRRLLRVYLLSNGRMDGTLAAKPWPGTTVWANELDAATRATLTRELGLTDASLENKNGWLTEMEDHSAPRPGTADVYFTRSTDQATMERPPLQEYYYDEDESAGSLERAVAITVLVIGFVLLGIVSLGLWLRMRQPTT